ncbi:hypothetical protein [uncultured Croceicoccus sp.]|uniref:hypothetical protein n=1 Tax=uncultured Croceicoccus sp. TaxID=1295329 RepID=UPI00262674D4|nr:hypothetical protein [uncultured Croceicoccus sp.]
MDRILSRPLPRIAPRHGRIAAALFAMATAGAVPTQAFGDDDPVTRLVRCGEASCLMVSGRRDDPAAIVKVNGRPVFVEGGKGWKLRLSLDTLREWSDGPARTIAVSLHAPDRSTKDVAIVDLPIGVLGDTTDLDTLRVRVR